MTGLLICFLPGTEDSLWGLHDEALKGLQSLILKKQQKTRNAMKDVRSCYLKVFTKAETNNILHSFSDYSDSDSDMSDDIL